jgi:gliding motility-associated-like protein
MKFIFLFLTFLLAGLAASAQQTFIRAYNTSSTLVPMRLLSTADNGFVLLAPDSLKLTKINSCGIPQWSRRYTMPGTTFLFNSSEFLNTKDGGTVFFTRYFNGTRYAVLLIKVNQTGDVVWNKAIDGGGDYSLVYTINEDAQGNLYFYGMSGITDGPSHNMLVKSDANGNILWTRLYNLGVIWGGAIRTSDGGFLCRTGNRFIKTSANGDVQWASGMLISSQNYFAPVEVADGYIFTTDNGGSSGICFIKLDKQGNLAWGGLKRSPFKSTPLALEKKSNGNFTTVFNYQFNFRNYPVLVEFDKDLNIVRHNALYTSQPAASLQAQDHFTAPDGSLVATGIINWAQGHETFVAKTGAEFAIGCDTLLTIPAFTTEPVSQEFLQVTAIPHQLNQSVQALSVQSRTMLHQTVCGAGAVPLLELGPDTSLCPGFSATLRNTGGFAFDSYQWNTGATTASISVNQPGTYWLKATYGCGSGSVTDTVEVLTRMVPDAPLVADTSLCETETIRLNAQIPGATYIWKDGSTSPAITVTLPGVYSVDVTVDGCTRNFSSTVTGCELLLMPNIFTPNHDRVNDVFVPSISRGIPSAQMEIYNRWGQKIYSTSDLKTGWDGKQNNKLAPHGIYYWTIRYTNFMGEEKTRRGYVELLR